MTLSSSAPNTMEKLDPDRLQRGASDPNLSVWVAASAGSGKTKVLADRVLRLLLAGVNPQKLLCLTFTRATAAQMKLRITEQLSRWATCDESALYTELDRLQGDAPAAGQIGRARRLFAEVLNCPGGLRLRTIHAFCQEILNRFPLEAHLPPQFTVLDENDAHALLKESFADLLRQAGSRAAEAEAVTEAMDLLADRLGEAALFDLLKELGQDPDSLSVLTPESLGTAQRKALNLETGATRQDVLLSAMGDHALPVAALREAAKLLMLGAPSFAARGRALADLLTLTPEERAKQFDAYARLFLKQDGTVLSEIKLAGKAQREKDPSLGPLLLSEGQRLMSVIANLEALRTVEMSTALVTLARSLADLYAKRKRARSSLDYEDLVRHAVLLFRREGIAPWVLFKLDGGIDHILLDEAQDTSIDQWEMVDILAREFFSGETARNGNRTLFVVGDEKQSIYSFRKADPQIFADMHRHFHDLITSAKTDGWREVPLNISFRSAPAILNAVDRVFASDSVRQGVASTPVQHFAWHKEAVGRVEVWPLFVPTPNTESEDEVWTPPTAYETTENPAAQLAERIAANIKSLLQDPPLVRGRYLTAGDVMVLVQRRNAFVSYLVRALKRHGVPVSGVDRMNLAEQLPVTDLMSLLSFVLLPEDDLNLAVLLKGPLLGLDDNDLMKLAIGRTGTLWQALKDTKDYARHVDYLTRWLARADQVPPFALLSELLHSSCPADATSGKRALWKRLGPQALDPIEEFLNSTEMFSARHAPSLQAFIQWASATETEIKREMDQSSGEVRITTVHASKGLEASVVFLPDTTRLPDAQKLKKILWNKATPFYIPASSSHPFLQKLRDEARVKQLEEYRRLLYVALTRAEDRLYIAGYTTERTDQSGQNWYAEVTAALREADDPQAHLSDEVLVIQDPDPGLAPKARAETVSQKQPPLPDYAYRLAAKEADPVRPLAPSHPSATEPSLTPRDKRFARGLIIHRLLQTLPDIAPQDRAEAARRFLANPQHPLDQTERALCAKEVLALLSAPDFAPLFGATSRAEVPLTGFADGRLISGQIDRLCVMETEVWIVDYKTNRPPPKNTGQVPDLYRAQMAAYATLLKGLYPTKKIRCFLLWTHTPMLMPLT